LKDGTTQRHWTGECRGNGERGPPRGHTEPLTLTLTTLSNPHWKVPHIHNTHNIDNIALHSTASNMKRHFSRRRRRQGRPGWAPATPVSFDTPFYLHRDTEQPTRFAFTGITGNPRVPPRAAANVGGLGKGCVSCWSPGPSNPYNSSGTSWKLLSLFSETLPWSGSARLR
jgi:hypothetical protein